MADVWANLPTDLLLLILNSETLTVTDVISFSSVCTSWRFAAATSNHRRHIRCQSPWLMFVGKEDPNSAQLYSFSNNKVYTIPNQPDPPIASRIFIGSAHGWLITADGKSELFLLNPITRQQIELPHFAAFSQTVSCSLRGKFTCRAFPSADKLRNGLCGTLSSSPASGDYVVVLHLREPFLFAFARAGDKKWTDIDNNYNYFRRNINIAFHEDGKMYATGDKYLSAWDFNKKDSSLIKPELVCRISSELINYLVLAPWGELLLVLWNKYRYVDHVLDRYDPKTVDIWRIGHGAKFTKLENLGDYTLFLGGGGSSICVSSKDNPQIRGNSLNVFDWITKDTQHGDRDSPPDVCIFSLDNRSIEHILPNDPRMNWPSPIWIMPSLE